MHLIPCASSSSDHLCLALSNCGANHCRDLDGESVEEAASGTVNCRTHQDCGWYRDFTTGVYDYDVGRALRIRLTNFTRLFISVDILLVGEYADVGCSS